MSDKKSKRGRFWLIIFALLLVIGIIAVVKSGSSTVSVAEKTVLFAEIRGELSEISTEEAFPPFTPENPVTHQGLLKMFRKAKKDSRIQRIVLKIENPSALFSKLTELREAIEDFRTTGREVWAYLSVADDADYYLASACNKIFIQPYGMLMLDGLVSERLYYKNTLEKIGVEFEAARRGKFKSAVETYVGTGLSNEDRIQREAYLKLFDSAMVAAISSSRKISKESFLEMRTNKAWLRDDDAVAMGYADSALFFDQLKGLLKNEYNESLESKLFISRKNYENVSVESEDFETEQVAVVYIMGGIVDGKGGAGNTGDEPIVKALNEIARNSEIKGVLLRVDSPGGSAVASDKIKLAIENIKNQGKPVVVSMSDLAASGGYWVAMNANKIVASPYTITGSIGVFSMKPNIQKLQSMIDLKRDVITTSKYADGFNLFQKFSPEMMVRFDAMVDGIYQRFLANVAEGRGKSIASIDSIAQGRVWTGLAAKEIGLVDELGGFYKALEVLKEAAGINPETKLALVEYPKPTSIFETIFEEEEDVVSIKEIFFTSLRKNLTKEILSSLFGPIYSESAASHFEHAVYFLKANASLIPVVALPYEETIH
ncbi:MAG: signal peptide peptidase SppA [Chloroherpetonaceae bacterium]|nr:signal peptide peptidase SppA [Chloroherpetonaceae bacterium]